MSHVVTGAFGFTGRFIARRLLERGEEVRTLTGHPDRPDSLRDAVDVHPYDFARPGAMARAMEGAEVLHNTYWIRFERGGRTFEGAVENSRRLFRAARRAGIGRIVHVSITNPSLDSPLPYFRGKARVERALADAGVPHSVLRPALLFGEGDVLLNNIAWILRRFPLFPVPGDGEYPVRPIHVDDLAALAVREARREEERRVLPAVGPEEFGYGEMVRRMARVLGTRTATVHVPGPLALALARVFGLLVRDVVLTRDELRGLTAGLLTAVGPAAGETRLTEWLEENRDRVGGRWASELDRHFR